ncbi:MAG: transposase [Urechidicola sp.]|jgi:hypothetical protein
MNLLKIEGDKSNSRLIFAYAIQVHLKLRKGNSKDEMEHLQLTITSSLYTKQCTILKNITSRCCFRVSSKVVKTYLKRRLRQLTKEMEYLEDKVLVLLKLSHQDLLTHLEYHTEYRDRNGHSIGDLIRWF